eukprot:359190-Prymnesium_polylepis.2
MMTVELIGNDFDSLPEFSVQRPSRSSWLDIVVPDSKTIDFAKGIVNTYPRPKAIHISMTVSASNLCESREPYQETVVVEMNTTHENILKQMEFTVKIYVRAITQQIVWGMLRGDAAACDGSASADRTPLVVTVGEVVSVPFYACDDDGLPVGRGMPNEDDNRTIAVEWRSALGGTANATSWPVQYWGDGKYTVHVQPDSPGHFTIELAAEGASSHEVLAPPRAVSVVCPSGGYEAAASCVPCPEVGAACPRGSALATIVILPGFWRIGNASVDLRPCPRPSRCVGSYNTSADGDSAPS